MVDTVGNEDSDELQVVFMKCKKGHGFHEQHCMNFAGRIREKKRREQLALTSCNFRKRINRRQFSCLERGRQHPIVVINSKRLTDMSHNVRIDSVCSYANYA